MAMEIIPGPNLIVTTPPSGDSSNRPASTAFVTAAIAAIPPPAASPIPAGTVMLFFQAAAPTGWTQVVSQNDKALRVVSGTGAGTGGSVAFSTVFAQSATGGTSLSVANIPSGTFLDTSTGISAPTSALGDPTLLSQVVTSVTLNQHTSGSGTAHTHPMDIRVQFIDLILASKD